MGLLSDLVTAFNRTRARLKDDAVEGREVAPAEAGPAAPVDEEQVDRTGRPVEPAAGLVVVFDPTSVQWFPDLESRSMRVVGVGHYLEGAERDQWRSQRVVLVAEPSNPVDANAVTVALLGGRKVGYLSAGTAKLYQPLLLELGPISVPSRADGRKLWIDVPRVPALRKLSR